MNSAIDFIILFVLQYFLYFQLYNTKCKLAVI